MRLASMRTAAAAFVVRAAFGSGLSFAAQPVATIIHEAEALPAQLQDFDAYVEGVRRQFDVPGIAVAIELQWCAVLIAWGTLPIALWR